ncbi:hypothetical protein NDI45_19545 [Leptolyngbya sp. GB1-A1]|uniref:hypothetical protein n=1 Tax=Leptolyngbya sp. GB1-A1 TaxID=2933908 RepID=UPI0032981885
MLNLDSQFLGTVQIQVRTLSCYCPSKLETIAPMINLDAAALCTLAWFLHGREILDIARCCADVGLGAIGL